MLKYSIMNRCSKNAHLKVVTSQLASTGKKVKVQYEQSPVTRKLLQSRIPIQCNLFTEVQG